MADNYTSTIVVNGIPADFLVLAELAHHHQPRLLSDSVPFRVPMVHDGPEDTEGWPDEEHVLNILNDAWNACEWDDVAIFRKDDGTFTLHADCWSASYGIQQQEDIICDPLTNAGLAFNLSDEGMYENPGRCIFWKPGMDGMEERTANQHGIVMESHQADQMLARAEESSDDDSMRYHVLVKLMRIHFGN